ncbi:MULTISPECIES: thiolase family protein [unclassified Microbacterium]|uniref:thiolase family protein n=1 Tax=unclassified Microbacterium TaxID=2609290 RepID=UPI0019239518|nr:MULTISPECIES: thiolase family protein [unclassified Microbacterium]QYM65067.1 thiolase family protein [Microbacterium sp. Se5.02b]
MSSSERIAIAGLGMSDIGKVYDNTATQFASIAVRDAVRDAGLHLADIDGLIMSSGLGGDVGLDLQVALGLTDLRLLTFMQGYGSTAAQMVQYAGMAVRAGMAKTIAIVWADAPLKENLGGGAAYKAAGTSAQGWRGMLAASGIYSANTYYALAARRHMQRFGTTNDHFGAIAVAQREWALMNPLAQMRTPITMEDYHASRYISEPFHLLDCCLVSNGAIALIVTSLEHATALAQPPVEVLGWAQTHPGRSGIRHDDFGLTTGAAISGPAALRMADTTLDEIDLVEVYDCYTYTALVTLEDYGFCPKGRAAASSRNPACWGPAAPSRSTPGRRAVVLLPLGHDSAVGGRDPDPRPGRRSPGGPA